MDLTPYLDRLREDLATSASAGDQDMKRTAAVLSAALEPAARLTLMNALADMAAEVTAQLQEQVVEVRLDGRDVRVAVTGPGPRSAAGAPTSGADTDAGDDPDITGGATGGTTGGGDPGDAGTSGPGGTFGDFSGAGGDISRITLRIVEQIKAQAEQAAAAQGQSLNAFVAQAVQQAVRGGRQGRGNRPGRGADRTANRESERGDCGPGPRSEHTTRSHLHGWVEG
ncbi:toxin-antitoxin system HicB family antitoxin [Prauserella halophila]|uniref:Toxin-antitoxin system HicB family antitoxin n=1 Tax=Prauserella halophila TaxID=185641 RepID=A0ABP4GJ57_9PSEU|nr:toxin-antitoxin system HicB family antitoxin [Prauserella halophila]MCP2234410.1 HicB family protein [Prauserella halophila]